MAGIVFPNVVGTLAPLMQLNQSDERNALWREESDARKSAAPFIQGALSGDPGALNEVATRHPDSLTRLMPLIISMDANKRAKVKEDADFITQNGMAILNAPPEAQRQLYDRVRQEAEASGRNVSQWPTQYDSGWVKFNVDKAISVAEHVRRSGESVTFAPPVGGDGQPPGGGVNPNNIGNVRPVGPNAGFQQPATFDDGVRLAVNNARAYPAAFNGGQPMTLMQIGQRWAPKGDGANDPTQWARNVASVSGLDPNRPLDLNDPQTAAAFARGVHGAEHGANKVQPPEVYARIIAGGGPPGVPQGGDPPLRGDGSGNPIQPAQAQPQAVQLLRGLQIPTGARVALQNGVPIVKDGNVLYLDANGGWGAAPLPARAEPKSLQPPVGYQPNPADGGLMPIPGGPADAAQVSRLTEAKRRADEKAIPQTVTKGIQENVNNLKQIDRALAALEKNPGSVGGVGSMIASVVPGAGNLQNRIDTEGVDLRALIGNIGSLVIHERSGAAVTASEFPRLRPFIPDISDSPETVKKKLNSFKANYEEIIRDTLSYYGPENGFREYKPAAEYVNKGQPQVAPVGGPAEQGRALFEARDAISKGAPREAVIDRLTKMGVDPSGL